MPSCAVYGCKSGYATQKNKAHLRWFNFPKDDQLRKRWIHRLNREDFTVTEHTQICSRHFTNDDYVPDDLNKDKFGRPYKKRHLKKTAVPSVDMGSHLQPGKLYI